MHQTFQKSGFAVIKRDNKYGYIDKEGNIIKDFEYSYASDFNNNIAIAEKNGKYITLYSNGTEIKEYDFIIKNFKVNKNLFLEDLEVIEKDNKEGYINKNMEIIINPKYDFASEFHEGLAIVENNNNFYIVDKTGKELFDLQKVSVDTNDYFSDDLLVVKYNNKCAYINKSFKFVSNIYDEASTLKNGMGLVNKNGKYGFIDKSGKLVINLIYDEATDFADDVVIVKKNEKYGIINKQGQEVVGFEYDKIIRNLSNDKIFSVTKDGENYYIDKNETRYDDCKVSDDNWISISNNGKYGYIDKNLNLKINYQFELAENFYDGISVVVENEKYACLDKNGRMVYINANVQEMKNHSEGLIGVKINGKWGFADVKTGNIVINPEYDDVQEFHEDRAVVIKNNKQAYIDKNGNIVIGKLE